MPENVLSVSARVYRSTVEGAYAKAGNEMKSIESRPLWLAVTGAGILLGQLGLTRYHDLAASAVETILLVFETSIFYLISCFFVLRKEAKPRAICWWILIFALCSRALLAPAPPTLSEDLYRYRWEGRVQLAGGHPYTAAPLDERWRELRDETYPRLAGKDIRFGYGPLWCEVEKATARLAAWATPDAGAQVLLFKLPAAAADLGVIAALMWVLSLYGLARERVLMYAWCPLVTMEFWHSGHNDALMVLFLVLALGCAKKEWWLAAGAMVGLAAMVKIWPVFLLPLFFAQARRWSVWAGAAAVALPFTQGLPMLWERRDFVTGFLGGWRNNDSLFSVLFRLSGNDGQVAKMASLTLIALWALWLAWRRMEPARGTLLFVVGMLLVSANVHPWYLTWFAPLLALLPNTALLAWVSLMPLCYAVLIEYSASGRWNGSQGWQWYVYAGMAAAWLASRIATRLQDEGRSVSDGKAREGAGVV